MNMENATQMDRNNCGVTFEDAFTNLPAHVEHHIGYRLMHKDICTILLRWDALPDATLGQSANCWVFHISVWI